MKKFLSSIISLFLIIFCLTSCSKSNEIAKILLDYEQTIKEEIEASQNKYPEKEYFYHGVDEVLCTYILNNESSAYKIAKKHKMDEIFKYAVVTPHETIKFISIDFHRNDFTETVHKKLLKIKEKDPAIKDLHISFRKFIVSSSMPKIDYYETNAVKINFEKVEEVYNPSDTESFIIKSKNEYNDYLNNILLSTNDNYYTNKINSQKDLYNDAFFEENALIITKIIIRGSGSIQLTINDLYISNNKLYVVIKTDIPGIGTDDMQYTSFSIKVSQKDVENITEVITLE